jgi:hypothetical protein
VKFEIDFLGVKSLKGFAHESKTCVNQKREENIKRHDRKGQCELIKLSKALNCL